MTDINTFLAMGGYAAYVWPALIVTAAVMAALVVVSRRTLRAREAELEALRRARREGAGEADDDDDT